ncbi:hypothetical protein HGA34_01505 [Candidatus Falkowbacteria bacterium]|nr:hypothetical protein [Candidatus Falkowbacteria bacterium]
MHWFRNLGTLGKIGIVVGSIVTLALLGLFVFWLGWVNFVDNYQLAYKFDKLDKTGKIQILKETQHDGKVNYERGWIVTTPIAVKVHTVDLRPMQVCMNANSRVLNCKLVEFNPDGLELFLSWHGRNDYEGPSSSGSGGTSTQGATHSTTKFSEILTSYAYDGNEYPFLTIIKELKPETINNPVKTSQALAPKAEEDKK